MKFSNPQKFQPSKCYTVTLKIKSRKFLFKRNLKIFALQSHGIHKRFLCNPRKIPPSKFIRICYAPVYGFLKLKEIH